MQTRHVKLSIIIAFLALGTVLSQGQTSELYILYSPNVIYPVGATSVYQGGHLVRGWTHAGSDELSMAVVGGSVRQDAVAGSGSEYTLAGVPTGVHYSAAPDTYDGASDGSSIYGWNVVSGSLRRYDLNWNYKQTMFSLGSAYSYAYMGITYDPQNNSVWLSAWSTGSLDTRGYLYDYSLDGHLLSTLKLTDSASTGGGLAYDPADNTLWFFNWTHQRYEQYSKSGALLSTMTGMTRIYGAEFAAVPEPCALSLFGAGTLLTLWCRTKSAGTRRYGAGARVRKRHGQKSVVRSQRSEGLTLGR